MAFGTCPRSDAFCTAAVQLGLFSTCVELARAMLAANRFRNLNQKLYMVDDVLVGAGNAPMNALHTYCVTKVPMMAHM